MRHLAISACLLGFSVPASAVDFEIINPDQDAFSKVSEDLVASFNYKALYPAEATGITGIGLGAVGSFTPTENEQAWQTLIGEDVSELGFVGGALHKGLPFGIDLGAFYATVPDVDGSPSLYGAEVRWAIWEGGVATPGVAVRGAFTQSADIDEIELTTYSLDASISKGFAFITPYAGAGYVWGTVEAEDQFGLEDEDVGAGRLFAGLRLSLGFLEVTPEYEHVGDANSYNLRLGLSF